MKKILILGAAESGVGAAVLAQKQGFEVFVSDNGKIKDNYRKMLIEKKIPFEEGTHEGAAKLIAPLNPPLRGDLAQSSNVALPQSPPEGDLGGLEIIKSPVIPDNVPLLVNAREKGIPIISEIEFAGRYTDAKKICITGSNGKTTTAMLTYHILKNAGLNVSLAGNVGKSFALQVAEENFKYYVLEISSFQLDGMYDFRANVAIITNITPDHLDRYDNNFQNYVNSKFRILQNQTKDDYFIFWSGDETIITEISQRYIRAKKLPFSLEKTTDYEITFTNVDSKIQKSEENFAFTEDNFLKILKIEKQQPKTKSTNQQINKSTTTDNQKPNQQINNNQQTNQPYMTMELENIAIKGVHNLYNSMAAGLAAQVVNIQSDKIRRALETFDGVEHRMEYVASVRGVRYINDSKATNVNSTWYALESMQTPVVLILGGEDKGNDYAEIADLVRKKVRTLIFLGKDNEKLKKFFANFENKEQGTKNKDSLSATNNKIKIIETKSMQEAVDAAYEVAKHGDTVLLSPCCASFDLFKDYEDRGRQFKECVIKL